MFGDEEQWEAGRLRKTGRQMQCNHRVATASVEMCGFRAMPIGVPIDVDHDSD